MRPSTMDRDQAVKTEPAGGPQTCQERQKGQSPPSLYVAPPLTGWETFHNPLNLSGHQHSRPKIEVVRALCDSTGTTITNVHTSPLTFKHTLILQTKAPTQGYLIFPSMKGNLKRKSSTNYLSNTNKFLLGTLLFCVPRNFILKMRTPRKELLSGHGLALQPAACEAKFTLAWQWLGRFWKKSHVWLISQESPTGKQWVLVFWIISATVTDTLLSETGVTPLLLLWDPHHSVLWAHGCVKYSV